MKILISAAEASSDVHGAQLLAALRKTAPPGETVEAFGIGGSKLQASGLKVVTDSGNLLAMGLFAVIARLPKILQGLKEIGDAAEHEKPDLAVVIDYPDFHFRLSKRLHKLGIPTVYFIPPKVWVWRQGRVQFLSKFFMKILCILPFEETFYRRRGVRAQFVGNPIVDELPFGLTREAARENLRLGENDRVVVMMPGSRPAEVNAHFQIMLDAATRTAVRMGERLTLLIPFPGSKEAVNVAKKVETWRDRVGENKAKLLDLRISKGNAHECLVAADAGLIKSGTSTLEAALLMCPHAILYCGSRISHWIFNTFIRYEGPVGLANLAALTEPPGKADRKKLLFSEFVMEDARADFLSEELLALLTNSNRRADLHVACLNLKRSLMGSTVEGASGPSFRAAEEIWSLYRELQSGKVTGIQPVLSQGQRVASFAVRTLNRIVSEVWSFVNGFMRFLSKRGLLKPVRLGARVISVGNIQAGGSGKTPLVAQIAREAISQGKKVAILIRGYRGAWEKQGGVVSPGHAPISPEECGDEAALLHALVPESWIGVGADRVARYREIQKKLGVPLELVILDDGFQNWKIRKDVDVVAVTSAGRSERLFRDSACSLRMADLVVWTKGESWPFPKDPMDVRVRYRVRESSSENPFILVTGVGDSDSVLQVVRAAGYRILKHLSFPDHARYAEPIVRSILKEAQQAGAKVLTTGKDWVKWQGFLKSQEAEQIEVIEPELIFEEGRENWSKQLWES